MERGKGEDTINVIGRQRKTGQLNEHWDQWNASIFLCHSTTISVPIYKVYYSCFIYIYVSLSIISQAIDIFPQYKEILLVMIISQQLLLANNL